MIPLSSLARRWSATPPNLLAAEIETARREGRAPLDIVTSNPHENGLEFPAGQIEEIVARAMKTVPSARVYRPDSRGQPAAREAIAAYYQRRGARDANPERIVLTAGTSLGYYYALRILLEPGDELLAPSPSYPLFDDLCPPPMFICACIIWPNVRRRKADGGPISTTLNSKLHRERAPLSSFRRTTRPDASFPPPNGSGLERCAGGQTRRHSRRSVLRVSGPGAPRFRVRARRISARYHTERLFEDVFVPGWKVAWMKADGADGAEVARFLTPSSIYPTPSCP
jgi:hypothetical protein